MGVKRNVDFALESGDDRSAERNIGHKVAVHHIHVQHIGTGIHSLLAVF